MELKLTGDKMTLESRPESEAGTASARSAHLVHGRGRTPTPAFHSRSVQSLDFFDAFSDEESENQAPSDRSTPEALKVVTRTPQEESSRNDDTITTVVSDHSKPTAHASSEAISNILADIRNKTDNQIKTLKNIAVADHQFTKNFKSVCEFLEESCNTSVDIVGDSSATIMQVKKQLSLYRQEKVIAQQMQAKRELQLQNQLKEMDAVVHRHQHIIDKLTQDKVNLNQRCEALLTDLDHREKHYQRNLQALENRHKEELRKAREMTLAGERMRRDEWMEKEKKKIKQNTLKAVQSEMQAMHSDYEFRENELITSHKKQLSQTQKEHEASSQAQLENLRKHLSKENEKAMSAEISSAQKRAAASLAAERQSMEEQRQRWMREYAARNAECEARETAAIAEKAMAVARAKELCAHELSAAKERQQVELALARDNYVLALKKAELVISKKFEEDLRIKERQIRSESQAERNEEIERVIDDFQGDLAKLKDDHHAELQNITTIQARETKALKERVAELDRKLEQKHQDFDALKEEFRGLTIRKNALESKATSLQNENHCIIVRHSQEMDTIHQKVKESITKRDEKILKLKDKINMLQAALND